MNKNSSFTFDIASAISPIDGRNRHKLTELSKYYSDFVLTRYRVELELKYLIKLSEYKVIRKLTKNELASIYQLIKTFSFEDYKRVREVESVTNHEAKAAEEFVKEKLRGHSGEPFGSAQGKRGDKSSTSDSRIESDSGRAHSSASWRTRSLAGMTKSSLSDIAEMVHFGLTSDDINNLAYALMIKNCLHQVLLPELEKILKSLKFFSARYKSLPMLARTHGQPAAPTTLGKEFLVYNKRLEEEIRILGDLEIRGKLTGNTGNLNAHKFIFPKVDWLKFSQEFVSSLGLEPDLVTTQIQSYDSLIRLFQALSRINNILLGLSVDSWFYISLGYFKQKLINREVGSTAMPHKINPIYFEGAEGGFGIANALFEFYCRKLSYSRLQRDLSDSTVRRSFGIAFAYSLLSYQSINKGLSRIEAHKDNIKQDLEKHFEVVSEAIQNFLRSKKYSRSYDKTKLFFRGREVNSISIKKFIKSLSLDKKDELKLTGLLPENYTGYAEELVDLNIKD